MSTTTPELCPFCAKPITREYGSFRCKNCAHSSEDMIDIERKNRAQAIRKAARAATAERKASTAAAVDTAPEGGKGKKAKAKAKAIEMAVARHVAKKKTGSRPAAAPRKKKSDA